VKTALPTQVASVIESFDFQTRVLYAIEEKAFIAYRDIQRNRALNNVVFWVEGHMANAFLNERPRK
jgi:hypothetical protein